MRAVARCAPHSAGSPRKVTPPQHMRLRARRGRVDARNQCACGRARGQVTRVTRATRATRATGVTVASAGAHAGDDATLRDAGYGGYGCKRCVASPCGYAARVWPCPPRGPVVPRWRLRSARPPAHGHPRPAYLLSGWVPWATGASALRRAE